MEVTQEDRDAAAALHLKIYRDRLPGDPVAREMILSGGSDDNHFIQAFARHRTAALAAKEAELAAALAKMEMLREALADIAEARMPEFRPDGSRRWFNGGEGFYEWATERARATLAETQPERNPDNG